MDNNTTIIDVEDLNETTVSSEPTMEQALNIRSQKALGIMDHYTKRLVKSAELLSKKVEHLALIYDEHTFELEAFKEVPSKRINLIKNSVESFPVKNVQEFITKMEKLYDDLDSIHRILTKK